MNNIFSANELKTKGISRLDEIADPGEGAIISVRGNRGYVCLAVKFISKHPELMSQLEKTLRLLEANPVHPSLRLLHRLSGNLEEVYSVSINIGYRTSPEFMIQEDTIIPVDISTHDEVY